MHAATRGKGRRGHVRRGMPLAAAPAQSRSPPRMASNNGRLSLSKKGQIPSPRAFMNPPTREGKTTCGAAWCRLMAMVVYPEDQWCCRIHPAAKDGKCPMEIETSEKVPFCDSWFDARDAVSVCGGADGGGGGVSLPCEAAVGWSGGREPAPLPSHGLDIRPAMLFSGGTHDSSPDF
jgi:hypothetical protein